MIVSWLTDGPTDSWFMTNGAKIFFFSSWESYCISAACISIVILCFGCALATTLIKIELSHACRSQNLISSLTHLSLFQIFHNFFFLL